MAKVVRLENKKKALVKEAAINKNIDERDAPAYYQKCIKENPLDQKAYNRLMILYRKLKEYKKELHTINSAIRAFDAFYNSHKKKPAKAIQSISSKLNKALGLTDKRGKAIYDHEPVAGWKKRKDVVLSKIK